MLSLRLEDGNPADFINGGDLSSYFLQLPPKLLERALSDEGDIPLLRPFVWLGNSRKCLQTFPVGAQKLIGDELQLIQFGGMPKDAKPFKGGSAAGLLRLRFNMIPTHTARS